MTQSVSASLGTHWDGSLCHTTCLNHPTLIIVTSFQIFLILFSFLVVCTDVIGDCAGRPVDWMDSSPEESSLWQQMLERPNMWVYGELELRHSMAP